MTSCLDWYELSGRLLFHAKHKEGALFRDLPYLHPYVSAPKHVSRFRLDLEDGRASVICTATGYALNGRGIETR